MISTFNCDLPSAWAQADRRELDAIGPLASSFLSMASNATGRSTYYNSAAEQAAAEDELHDRMLATDRGLYAVLAAFPGVLDRAREQALPRLLSALESDDPVARSVPKHLARTLPIPRALRAFGEVRRRRTNNARTRRVILTTLLRADKIELWAVKYRKKMRRALEHALGKRRAGIVASILAKAAPDGREWAMLRSWLGFGADARVACDAVGFALGVERDEYSEAPLLQAFVDAKRDLARGRGLPLEVLEGIRSVYHPLVPAARVLELSKDSLTATQRLQVQRRADAAGIEVAFDPRKHDAVRLYIHAFERGLDAEIRDALAFRAAQVRLPDLGRVAILVDGSQSMAGHRTQSLRPMAVALAVRDALAASARESDVRVCGGHFEGPSATALVWPRGATKLARALAVAAQTHPDAVFVISDGYENLAAGRFAEVVESLRRLGWHNPIYQINPVFAAEVAGARGLAQQTVPVLSVADAPGLEIALLIPLLTEDPNAALLGIYHRVRRQLPA